MSLNSQAKGKISKINNVKESSTLEGGFEEEEGTWYSQSFGTTGAEEY